MQYIILLCIVLVTFIIAVARQTVGALLLNSLLWLAMCFITFAVSDPTSGITQGSAAMFFMFFIVMFTLTVKAGFDKMAEKAQKQERDMVEGEVL